MVYGFRSSEMSGAVSGAWKLHGHARHHAGSVLLLQLRQLVRLQLQWHRGLLLRRVELQRHRDLLRLHDVGASYGPGPPDPNCVKKMMW